MKRFFTVILLFLGMGAVQAQTPDSVILGPSYAGRGYYTIGTGYDTITVNNDWDIAVASYSLMTASIRINAGFGVELYRSSADDTTDWATLDTTGLQAGGNWQRCHDSDTSFESSAFEAYATGHPNYGWGNYNNITHDVVGDKLFVIRLAGSSPVFKKVWIKKFDAMNNSVVIRVANLDNTMDNTFTVAKNSNKNYVHVALATSTVMDREPAKDSYDLIFDKYESYLGVSFYYPVAGVRSNDGIKVAEAGNIAPVDAYNIWYNNYYPSSVNMNEIGYDWKIFDGGTFTWNITDSLSYFVEDQVGDVYQIWFTGFGGSANGKYVFNVRQAGWVGVEDNGNTIANFNLYPNPASEFINVAYTLDNEFSTATLHITDVNGKLVSNQKLGNNNGFNTMMIDLSSLAPGMYVAQLNVGNATSTKKFIVE